MFDLEKAWVGRWDLKRPPRSNSSHTSPWSGSKPSRTHSHEKTRFWRKTPIFAERRIVSVLWRKARDNRMGVGPYKRRKEDEGFSLQKSPFRIHFERGGSSRWKCTARLQDASPWVFITRPPKSSLSSLSCAVLRKPFPGRRDSVIRVNAPLTG